MEESPFLTVEVIEERDHIGMIESLIAWPLAHMGPVLLFDVGVVIFVISPAAGKLNGVFSLGKMSEEVMIEGFGSVITIEAQQGEGKRFFDLLDLFENFRFSLSPDSSWFTPAGGDIDAADRISEDA